MDKTNTHTSKQASALEFRRLQQCFRPILKWQTNSTRPIVIKSQTNTTIMKQQARVFSPATHIQANRRRRVRFYKEANKDLSVQLNGTAFMRSFLCSGTHTQTHTLFPLSPHRSCSDRFYFAVDFVAVVDCLFQISFYRQIHFGQTNECVTDYVYVVMFVCKCVILSNEKEMNKKKTHIARASSLQCVRQTRVMEHERTGAIV